MDGESPHTDADGQHSHLPANIVLPSGRQLAMASAPDLDAQASDLEVQLFAESYYASGDPDWQWAAVEAKRRGLEISNAPPPLPPVVPQHDFPLVPSLQLSARDARRLGQQLGEAFIAKLEALGVRPELARTVRLDFDIFRRKSAKDEIRNASGYLPRLTVDRQPWCAPRAYQPDGAKAKSKPVMIKYLHRSGGRDEWREIPANPEYLKELTLVEDAVRELAGRITRHVWGKSSPLDKSVDHCITGAAYKHPQVESLLGYLDDSRDRFGKRDRVMDRTTPLEVAPIVNAFCGGYKGKTPGLRVDLAPFEAEAEKRRAACASIASPYRIDEAEWIQDYLGLRETPPEAELSNASTLVLAMMMDRLLFAKLQQLGVPAPLAETLQFTFKLPPKYDQSHYGLYAPAIGALYSYRWWDAKHQHEQQAGNNDKTDWPWLLDADGTRLEQQPPEYKHPGMTCERAFRHLDTVLRGVGKEKGEDRNRGDSGRYHPMNFYCSEVILGTKKTTPLEVAQAINDFCANYGGMALGQAIDLTPFHEEARRRHPGKYLHEFESVDALPAPDGASTYWQDRMAGFLSLAQQGEELAR